jgi:hypothetical protein
MFHGVSPSDIGRQQQFTMARVKRALTTKSRLASRGSSGRPQAALARDDRHCAP